MDAQEEIKSFDDTTSSPVLGCGEKGFSDQLAQQVRIKDFLAV